MEIEMAGGGRWLYQHNRAKGRKRLYPNIRPEVKLMTTLRNPLRCAWFLKPIKADRTIVCRCLHRSESSKPNAVPNILVQ